MIRARPKLTDSEVFQPLCTVRADSCWHLPSLQDSALHSSGTHSTQQSPFHHLLAGSATSFLSLSSICSIRNKRCLKSLEQHPDMNMLSDFHQWFCCMCNYLSSPTAWMCGILQTAVPEHKNTPTAFCFVLLSPEIYFLALRREGIILKKEYSAISRSDFNTLSNINWEMFQWAPWVYTSNLLMPLHSPLVHRTKMLRLSKVSNSNLSVQGCSATRSIFHRLLQADVSQGRYHRQCKYPPTQKMAKFCRHFWSLHSGQHSK